MGKSKDSNIDYKAPQCIFELKPAPYNPRRITGEALAGLKVSIAQFGDISGITWNSRTGHIVSGHQRIKSLQSLYGDKLTIEDGKIVAPDGTEFHIRVVDWDDATERAANVAANNPHIAGEFDDSIGDLLKIIADSDRELFDALRFGEIDPAAIESINSGSSGNGNGDGEHGSIYTSKITAPIYEITGECPSECDLYDSEKTNSLKREIDAANIPANVKAFLSAAANRHTVFHFKRIAEYYAHASPEVQSLMERSALVIIDFNKAIEYGFVKMTKAITCGHDDDRESEDDDDANS